MTQDPNIRMQLIKCASPQMGDEEIAAVADVIRSGQLVSGPKVEAFEERFADWIHHGQIDTPGRYACAVSSGTAALHLALLAAGVGPGDEVITTPLTFAASATAVLMCGARVVFADVDERLQMDWDHVLALHTERTKAIVAVHYMGDVCWPTPRQLSYLRGAGVTIIEDCAQAHGSKHLSQRVGSLGDFACWSFFATKHVSTGEGGMVMTGVGQLGIEQARKLRQARSHGLTNRWNHETLGYNYRMTEIAAAIGLVQMDKVDELNAAREAISEQLLDGTQGIPWLSSPARLSTIRHSFFWCPVIVDEDILGRKTDVLIDELRNCGVEVRHRYPVPLYRLPVMLKHNNPQPAPLPNAEHYAGRVIGLPNRPDMTQAEVARVLEVLHDVKVVGRFEI